MGCICRICSKKKNTHIIVKKETINSQIQINLNENNAPPQLNLNDNNIIYNNNNNDNDKIKHNNNKNINNNYNILQIQNNSKDNNYNKILNKNKVKNIGIDFFPNSKKYQNELNSNFKYFNVFWYDPYKNQEFKYFTNCFENVEFYEDYELNSTIDFFKKQFISEWIVVTPGSKGEELIKELENFECIKSFFIFCENVKVHEKWANKIKKVGCITSEPEILCQKFIEINKDYIIPNFNYQRKKDEDNVDILNRKYIEKDICFESAKIKSIFISKKKERNIYNNLCIKLYNYLKSKEFEEDLNKLLTGKLSLFFKTIFNYELGKEIFQSDLDTLKRIVLLSLYFNNYPYILNILTEEQIKNFVKEDMDSFCFKLLDLNVNLIIRILYEKILKNESILDCTKDIIQIHKRVVIYLSFSSDILNLNKNYSDYYQIVNFFRDTDFCLKLLILSKFSYFFSLKKNFLDEIILSMCISDIRFKYSYIYFVNIIRKESHFQKNDINLINNTLTIKDFIISGNNVFHKIFFEFEKKIKSNSFKYLNINQISNYLKEKKKEKSIIPYFYFLIINYEEFIVNYEKIILLSLESGITFLVFLYIENDHIIPKEFINFLLPTILIHSPEDILRYLSQKLNFYNPLSMPDLKKFVNLENSNLIFDRNNKEEYQDDCFELEETFDQNLIKNKQVFKFLDSIDYIIEFSKNIYSIYQEHNALDLFYKQNCIYFGWKIYPELFSFNVCFVKRFIYIYCREEKIAEKNFYRIIKRTRDPDKIQKYINILGLINQTIEANWLARYKGKVFRATKLNENLIKTLIPGTKMVNTTFWSTSKEFKIAEEFMKKQNFRNSYIICTTQKNNLDIDYEQLSPINEKEVLFLPFTEFIVEKVSTETKFGKKIFTIELTELENKYFVTYKNMKIENIDNIRVKDIMEIIYKSILN